MRCRCGNTVFRLYEHVNIRREYKHPVDLADCTAGDEVEADFTHREEIITRMIFECTACGIRLTTHENRLEFHTSEIGNSILQIPELFEAGRENN